MKKCPVCDKEFPDSMRFCQVDGTPLVDELPASAPPEDPFKTTVGRQEDIAAAIPTVDPFATMVNTSFKKEEPEDILQLPEEKQVDPLKTMYASESEIRREMEKDKSGESTEKEDDSADGNAFTPPAPPIFNEPNITPPTFGDTPLSEQKTAVVSNPFNEPKEDLPADASSGMGEQKTEIVSNPFSDPPKQKSSFEPKPASPFDQSPSSPFGGDSGKTGPIPSPFDNSMPPAYQTPSAPLNSYQESESSSLPKYDEPPVNQSANNNPFDNQSAFGQGAMIDNQNQNPPVQDQAVSQDAHLQPPVASSGASKTLAVASLICGVVSLLSLVGSIIPFIGIVCGLLSFGLAIAAIVTGFLARGRISRNPEQFQGAGLALGGIITGFLTVLGMIGLVVVGIILGVAMSATR